MPVPREDRELEAQLVNGLVVLAGVVLEAACQEALREEES